MKADLRADENFHIPLQAFWIKPGPGSGPTRKSLLNQIKLLLGSGRRKTVIKLMNFNSGIFTGRMIAFADPALRLLSYSTLIEISWPLPLQCVFITANGPPNISQKTFPFAITLHIIDHQGCFICIKVLLSNKTKLLLSFR